jgi:hypothetical protein
MIYFIAFNFLGFKRPNFDCEILTVTNTKSFGLERRNHKKLIKLYKVTHKKFIKLATTVHVFPKLITFQYIPRMTLFLTHTTFII